MNFHKQFNSGGNLSIRKKMSLPYNDSIVKLILDMIYLEPLWFTTATRNLKTEILDLQGEGYDTQHCAKLRKMHTSKTEVIQSNYGKSTMGTTRPFVVFGGDYCGPLWSHYKIRENRTHKVYIALFVCFATEAVNLNIVTGLTTLVVGNVELCIQITR